MLTAQRPRHGSVGKYSVVAFAILLSITMHECLFAMKIGDGLTDF